MDIPEFAALVDMPPSTAYELARKDRLPVPVLRIGRRYRLSRAAVEEWFAQRKPSEAGA